MWYFSTNSHAQTHLKWFISEQEATLAAQRYVSKVYGYTYYLLSHSIHPVIVKAMEDL
jgi:hypothetical protein